MDYKNSKWAREILTLQNEDGLWGYFHTLSDPSKAPITTEQALRRLFILGYSLDDEPIAKCISYMEDCLKGINQMPDVREKLHNWDIFTDLMLSTWIRKFTLECEAANKIARDWAKVISTAFVSGRYNHSDYISEYQKVFGMKPQGGRLVDFVSFYQVSLIANCLDKDVEPLVFDYILNHNEGIYYLYQQPLHILPDHFASKASSRYLAAMELLAKFPSAKSRLRFLVDWLQVNKNANGKWDMGNQVKDQVYFPLSDHWRQVASREADCTYRIEKLMQEISM